MESTGLSRPLKIAAFLLALILAVVGVISLLRIVLSALGHLADLPTGYSAARSVFTVISIGFLAMSLIQALRTITPVRAWFQKYQIRRWCSKTEKAILDWKELDREPWQSEKEEADVKGKAVEQAISRDNS